MIHQVIEIFKFFLSQRLNNCLWGADIFRIAKYSIHFVLYIYWIHYIVIYFFRNFFCSIQRIYYSLDFTSQVFRGITRDENPSRRKYGWNGSSRSFSMTHSDPIAGNKIPENFYNFKRSLLSEIYILKCAYYFFYLNRFTSLP